MAFKSDRLPSTENASSWGQMQNLQQLENVQQFLQGHYIFSSGNHSSISSKECSQDDIPNAKRQRHQDDIPKGKRRRLLSMRLTVEGSAPSSASARVTTPTPSASCSGSNDDNGEDLEEEKGLFHQLLLSPSKLKSEAPQFESPLKYVNVQHSTHNRGLPYPRILDLSCTPLNNMNAAPIPNSSLECVVGPLKPITHAMENCYYETPSVPVKSSTVIDVSDKNMSFNIPQNYKPYTMTAQDQSEAENDPVMSIIISNVISLAPDVFPFGPPEPLSGNDQGTMLSDELDNTSSTNGRPRSKLRKAKCYICNKKYENNYKLKLHMHTHTGERPFVCDICNKGFSRRPNLIAHQRVHSGAKPFSCTRGCGRDFSHPSDRIIHVITEVCTRMNRMLKCMEGGGYQCTTCGKQSQEKGHAERHVRQHAAGVGLICSQCGINFQGQKAHILVKHMRENHSEYIKKQGL